VLCLLNRLSAPKNAEQQIRFIDGKMGRK